jgi:hypothetical protein
MPRLPLGGRPMTQVQFMKRSSHATIHNRRSPNDTQTLHPCPPHYSDRLLTADHVLVVPAAANTLMLD